MRPTLLLAAASLVGCTVSTERLSGVGPEPDYGDVTLEAPDVGFARLAAADNPDQGVVPELVGLPQEGMPVRPIGWASMGDRLCEIDGSSGSIQTDVFLDPEAAPEREGMQLFDRHLNHRFLVAFDALGLVIGMEGGIVSSHPQLGPIVDAHFRADGELVTLVDTDLGCTLDHQVDEARVPLTVADGACGDAELEHLHNVELVRVGDHVVEVSGGEIVATHHASIVSADPGTGHVLLGQAGTTTLELDGRPLELPDPALDAAVRGEHVVVLTEAHELVLFEAPTGDTVATEPFLGSLDADDVALTADGRGLIVSGPHRLGFYGVYSQ